MSFPMEKLICENDEDLSDASDLMKTKKRFQVPEKIINKQTQKTLNIHLFIEGGHKLHGAITAQGAKMKHCKSSVQYF